MRSVSRFRVKPDRDGDFRAGVKEYIAVLKKAGADRGFTMWASLTGPREYVLVSYHSNYAEFDQSEDPKLKEVSGQLASIGSRLNACLESSERFIDAVEPDLSLPRSGEVPKVVRVMRTLVKADRVNDYTSLVKSEWMPHVKKSGIKTYLVTRVRYGRPVSEFMSVTGLEKWADLDGQSPVVKAAGDEAYQRYLAKVRPLTDQTEVNLYRHLPDLSYVAAK